MISQLEQDRQKLSIDNSVLQDYDQKMRMAGDEIDRLDNLLRNEINEKNRLKQGYEQLVFEVNRVPVLEK